MAGCSRRRVTSVNHAIKPPGDCRPVYLDRARVALSSFTERGVATFVNFMRNGAAASHQDRNEENLLGVGYPC